MPGLAPSNRLGTPGRKGLVPSRGCSTGLVSCPNIGAGWPSNVIVPSYMHVEVIGAADPNTPECGCDVVNGVWESICHQSGFNYLTYQAVFLRENNCLPFAIVSQINPNICDPTQTFCHWGNSLLLGFFNASDGLGQYAFISTTPQITQSLTYSGFYSATIKIYNINGSYPNNVFSGLLNTEVDEIIRVQNNYCPTNMVLPSSVKISGGRL